MHFAPPIHRRGLAGSVCSLIVLLLLASTAATAGAAASLHPRRPHLHANRFILQDVNLPDVGFLSELVPEQGPRYVLKLARQGEDDLNVTYRVGDTYILEGLDRLNQYLRDSHNGEVKSYDPRAFDLLYTMLSKLDRSGSVIEVLSGYRSKETNDALRASGTTNAAEHSQHIEATALDIRVPGVPAAELRDAALSLGAGGVGYYPKAQFIHVDTGNIRKWTYTPHRGRHSRHHGRAQRTTLTHARAHATSHATPHAAHSKKSSRKSSR
jgi:uncharacterized protein YcbK (DUF882 family)